MRSFELPTLEEPAGLHAEPEPEPVIKIDVEAITAAARAEGHDAGFAAGLAEAREQMAAGIAALAAAAAGVEEQRSELAAEVELAAVKLGLQIAEQALHATIDARPEAVVEVVRGALRRLVDRDRVAVLVHPDDLELVRTAAGELVAELGGIEHCEVQAERRVSRGGAIVRTVEGEVDATVQTKLARVREVLDDELRHG